MKKKLITIILLLTLLFVPASSAHAQEPDNSGDVFRLGENYTLSSDETLNGNLAVIGGNAVVEEDAVLNGDVLLVGGNLTISGNIAGHVAVIGGNLTITGKIDGDIAVIGGQAVLTETAVVNGEITTVGGQVEKDPEAQVSGDIVNNNPLTEVPAIPGVPNVPNVPNAPNTSSNPFWDVVNVFLRALSVAAVGMLLTLFLQPQLERVADAMTSQPIMAGSFGLLTIVVTPLALLIMALTLILIPVVIVVVMLILLAWLFGIIALGQEIGERFAKAINQIWAPVLSTGAGTFLLLLVSGLFGLIPCVGWLFSFLIALFAIGGVVMTWFGTRAAPGTTSGTPIQQVEVSSVA